MITISKDLISEWHAISKYSLIDDLIIKRTASINKILEQTNITFWKDIIKLYLGLPINGENISYFVTCFQENDSSFPRLKIEKLIRTLASITLASKVKVCLYPTQELVGDEENQEKEETFETGNIENNVPNVVDTEIAFLISSAIINSMFCRRQSIVTKIPLVEMSEQFIIKYGIQQRQVDFGSNGTDLSDIQDKYTTEDEDIDIEDKILLMQTVHTLYKNQRIQSEEINVLWWVFGMYSDIMDKYFNEIDVNTFAIVSAKEFKNLTMFCGESPSASHILGKILTLCNNSTNLRTVSVKDCIKSLGIEIKNKVLVGLPEEIDELTPCIFALKQSGMKDWENSLGFNIDEKISPVRVALQYYRELLFLHNLHKENGIDK